MKKGITVFVSSAMRELENEREIIQEVFVELNINASLFELFPAMSQAPLEAYTDEVRECDIFILIIWKSLRPAVKAEYEEAIRTNKPILIVIKSLIDSEERDIEAKRFITGLSDGFDEDGSIAKKAVFKNYRTLAEFRIAVRDSIKTELAKYYGEPRYTQSREEMYELGIELISKTQKRLYICQQTPSLILGAREYTADQQSKILYEQQFLDALILWIETNKANRTTELCYFFSKSNLQKELEDFDLLSNSEVTLELNEKIDWLCSLERSTSRRFRFTMTDQPFSGPLIISDNHYGIWILGSSEAISISKEDEKFCNMLSRVLRMRSQCSLETSGIKDFFRQRTIS
ncbi:MAG TPA: DUF4062 domain-containing protein [Pyrinomonadaceae bacterium]|mgnify:CR=1 FL=1|nr:DUF4062 domain-containing protein [Acidobacteriota bacterium]HQZ96588.1 DUF4062 domain-containing protein [Pyrinomonadaceae bacterium]